MIDAAFEGNKHDLEQFARLIESRPRSDEREQALRVWETYKLARQAAHIRGESGKRGAWQKGEYVRSLTAPAIDLRGATLRDVCLGYADLRGVRFDGARFLPDRRAWVALKGCRLECASLVGVSAPGARLIDAHLAGADLRGADLSGADLSGADLRGADLRGARLTGSNLESANLVEANLLGADLCGSRVFGVSAWDVQHDGNVDLQRDLVVTPSGRAEVRTDNIDVAQFMYLLLDNPRIGHFLDAVCKKGVLLLGRFTEERKGILDALRCELRNRGYLAMVFDFEKAKERDFTETVMVLAGMSRFIVADITKPKSSPLELQAVVPNYMVPLVPIIAEGESPFAMFSDLRGKYPWVLDPLCYSGAADLVKVLERAVIQPALAKHNELLALKAKPVKVRRTADYDLGD